MLQRSLPGRWFRVGWGLGLELFSCHGAKGVSEEMPRTALYQLCQAIPRAETDSLLRGLGAGLGGGVARNLDPCFHKREHGSQLAPHLVDS